MSTFALQVAAFAKKAGNNADLVVRKVAVDMLGRVVNRSPVDTGRFRGNWQTTIGAPASGNVATLDPSGAATVNAGDAALSAFEVGPSIFIVNNLPYAQRLEYGYSKQAPGGMVRVTALEYQGLISRAVEELPK